jgi:hypothetical protein
MKNIFVLKSKTINFQALLGLQDCLSVNIALGVFDKSLSLPKCPKWGSKNNNEDKVIEFSQVLAKYAPNLRGFTCYPDSARGGQPLTSIPYDEAMKHKDIVFTEHEEVCKGGVCGI